MSVNYQALYRKYRSQTFADLVGQEATSRALQGAIVSGRVAHAYLFSGTRGTGKTSTARLLAKALNCTERPADSAEPCDRCESCRAVRAGAALDLIEIDAASNRGIDEIRDLREKVNLAPSQGARKIYIIDEAHMLTTEAFNALLKTLEEPPEHVVFVLCTTEANKVPPTVLGRCQQFVFRRLGEEQIAGRLAHIAEREGIQVEPEALRLMAQVAQGSMRDGVGLLDQLAPLADGPITLAIARDLLGIADPAQLSRLLDHVLAGRAGEALSTLGEVYEAGGELRQVVRGLMERCRDRLVAAIDERDTALRDRLSSVLDGLLHLDGEVRRHAEPRFLVEATLVRLAVEVGSQVGSGAGAVPASPEPPPRAADRPAPAPVPAAAAPAPPQPAAPPPDPAPAPRQQVRATPPPPAPPPPEALPPEPPRAPAATAGDGAQQWGQILQALSPKVRAYYKEARVDLRGDRLTLVFPYSFHHKMATEHVPEVTPLVRRWLGESASLDLRLDEPNQGAGGPARPVRPIAPEEDPLVQEAVRKLEGRVTRVHGGVADSHK
jgi:DNA polymerase III subunit gamma/tau